MIDKSILDEVLPIPDMDTLRDKKIAELQEAGFIVKLLKNTQIKASCFRK